MVMNKSFDYRKAASAIAMALLVVSVSFGCMAGAEGMVLGKSGSADLTDNGNGTASAPFGSVESFNSPIEPTVSSLDDIIPQSYMTKEPYGICYWTPYGVYIFNESRPERMSLTSLNGTRLVEESFFTLDAEGASFDILGGKILSAVDERLEISYSLNDALSKAAWDMTVVYDFEEGKRPKITASVVAPDADMKGWNIAWVIIPGEDVTVDESDAQWAGISLDDIVGKRPSSSDLSITLNVGSEKLTIDWNDAAEGDLSVARHDARSEGTPEKERRSLVISFREGEEVIDPIVVGPTTSAEATGFACQRKMFWYDGIYWLFYNSGTAICYQYSADGFSWSNQVSLPQGTAPHSESGFDVAFRNGEVMVGWCDSIFTIYAKKGTVTGTSIQWSERVEIDYEQTDYYPMGIPVSVAIGSDGAFWIAYNVFIDISGMSMEVEVMRSPTGEPGSFSCKFSRAPVIDAPWIWNVLLPISGGNMVLLETYYRSSGSGNSLVELYYWMSDTETWSNAYGCSISMSVGYAWLYKSTQFSVVASPDGTVHIAYVDTSGHLQYAGISLDGTVSEARIHDYGFCPSICLDSNNILHISYFCEGLDDGDGSTFFELEHAQKPLGTGSWSDSFFLVDLCSARPQALTSWSNPVGSLLVAWTAINKDASRSIRFGSVPLPFGTSGYSSDPWDRDGLSPYGTYFAMNGQYISPGSGQLTLVQNDVSIAGRGGLDLGVSRIYQQPKYFMHNTPYDYKAFPSCNMGRFWSLDLPWMDDRYVYLANGQRFVIQWGNEGDAKEFVNHDGVHFVLRDVNKQGTKYYELITSAGLRYQFDHSGYALKKISDLANYDPGAASYTEPYNCLTLEYSGSRLTSITDSALGRTITFYYNSNGLLSSIMRPDGETIQYGYAQHDGQQFLASVTDADDRVTTFAYDPSSNYLLNSITYPSGGKVQYTYGIDQTPATEVASRLVTSESVRDAHTDALIRQTSFDYKIVNGKVICCKLVNYDERGAIQGSNVHIFQSALKSSSEIVLDSAGRQMQKTTTWYDARGQPSRVDTYSGSSAEVSYSEYVAYDDWGNVIFTRDALGHDSYYSYANTDTQNSFQGGTILERTSTSKIFHDAFDDWDLSDWTVDAGAGSVQLDGTADPTRAPSLKLSRTTTSGDLSATHQFAGQSGNFNMQTSFRTQDALPNYIMAMSGSTARINFESQGGYFKYYTGSAWVSVAPCAPNTWYDVGFAVKYSSNAYDIYIDGVLVKSNVPLLASGQLNAIRFQANSNGGTATALWFDDVRIYKSSTVTVSGMGAGDIVELYNSRGELLDRSKSGTLSIPPFSRLSLPAYIRLLKVGDTSISTPMMDIWGGDAYSVVDGTFIAGVKEISSGYAQSRSSIADDAWPSGSTVYSFNEAYNWAADIDYTVTGSKYRTSAVQTGSYNLNHGHGFKATSAYMRVNASDAIVQYIWLEEKEMPREIVLQYLVNGVWKRAYWGGDASGNDVFVYNVPDELKPLSQNVHRIGGIPQITGQWIQLTVRASDLGIADGSEIKGIIYGLRGGTAKWDSSGVHGLGVRVDGLSSGMTVKMTLVNGTTISRTATSGSVTLDLYSQGVRAFPISASFEIYDSVGTLVYDSPVYDEIYNYDKFSYEGTDFYANNIKSDLHSSLAGALTYQNDEGTTAQDSYIRYNYDGYPIASKSRLGSGWACTESFYNICGNLVSSTDAAGVRTYYEYGDGRTYLERTWGAAIGEAVEELENFGSPSGWTLSKGSSNGNVAWLVGQYSTSRYCSPSSSVELGFTTGAPGTYDTGSVTAWKEYNIAEVNEISTKMYVSEYSHDGRQWDTLDSAIRMRLYDASGTNYATYVYWLACWRQSTDNRTAPDSYTKVIYGKPPMNAWLDVVLHPSEDWDIDWSDCSKVRIELHVYGSGTVADKFRVNYDDLSIHGRAQDERGRTSYSYDLATGRLNSVTDAYDATTSYQYDVLGRTVRTTNPDGTFTSIAYDDENNKAAYYDELGRKTVSYYDVIGRLVKVESYGLSSTPHSQVTYEYNWQDKPVRVVDEMGRATECTYDYLGRQTSTTTSGEAAGPDTVSEDFETAGAWSFSKGSMNGNVNWLIGQYSTSKSTSPTHSMELGFTSGPMSYDSGSSAAWKEYDIGEVDEISARMYVSEWSHDGRQWDWLESGIKLKLYDSSGANYATYTYWLSCWRQSTDNHTAPDANTKIICGKPAMNTWLDIVLHPSEDWSIDWDDCSKVRVELYVYGSGTNADKFKVNYDDLSVEGVGSEAGRSVSYTQYDDVNRLVTYIDELGNKKVMKYDVLGRLNASREYCSLTQYYETLMSYDAAGSLRTVRQANGEVTRMHYDTLGRQTSILYPDGYSESWAYDDAGRVLESTSRSGLVTTSSYDGFGYLTSVASRSGTITTSYDLKGRVVERSNSLGSIAYWYNSMDRVVGMTETIRGASFAFSYEYDDVGNLLYVDYPDSGRVSYVYDDLDRLVDIVSGGTNLLHLAYNLDGSVATETYCSGSSVVSYSYNGRGWVSGISAEDRYGTDLLGLRYTYDAAGSVLKIRDVVGSAGTEDYQYDALGRLTKATGAWGSIQYGYDSVGNRLWKNENGNNVSYSYGAYNQLTSDGAWVFSYDEDGNMVHKFIPDNYHDTSFYYDYNSFGQMIQMGHLFQGWQPLNNYHYDANGARAMTIDPSGTSRFVYSGHDPVYEVSSDGTTNKYVYANGRLAVRIVNGTENDCYISDALGSTRLVLKNGNAGPQDILFSAVTYKPFGAVYSPTGSDQVTFAGETVDGTGLVYLFARYYDPELGRFMALDPEMGDLSSPQTMNRYSYCHNSPLIYKDPTGKFGIFGAAIGAVIGAATNVLLGAATGNLHSWEDVAKAAIVGGVSGAIAGATCGLGLAIGMGGGFAAGAVGEYASQRLDGKEIDMNSVLISGAIGAAFGGLGEFAPALKTGSLTKFISSAKNVKLVDLKPMLPYPTKIGLKEFRLPGYMDMIGAPEYLAGGNRAAVQLTIDVGLSIAESGMEWAQKRHHVSIASYTAVASPHPLDVIDVRTFSNTAV